MPPRKATPAAPMPPGPVLLELRAGSAYEQGKIVWRQRVHSYTIDPQDDLVTITAVMRLAEAPE